MSDTAFERRVCELRRFNRFYTQKIGVLEEGLLDSPFSLTEARVLYEIASSESPTATQLCAQLDLDRGYLSRILRGFERRGLIRRTRSTRDQRLSILALTEAGQSAFAALDARSQTEMGALLRAFSEVQQGHLVAAAATIERVLGAAGTRAGSEYLMRPHRAGDMGWIIRRHGMLYTQEYGWNIQFEALVAEIAAKFLRDFDPCRDCCRIAEKDGENVGSAMVVAGPDQIAHLRLLLVEPHARGLGIGTRLVQECLQFAREAHYQKISLWTNSVLVVARRLYASAGFRLVDARPHHSFGQDLVGETWELAF
jgi:DNA-binding MarR family transcriptional regulator/GNAT superfamily N-acetyltransferase